MILTRLSATNFRCFRELDLTELPRRGVVVLFGANESGKSTIGDALCFALFGRTWATGRPAAPPALASLIRWGADFAEVELECELPGRGGYRIFREIDRAGVELAQLEELSSHRVVTGAREVSRELQTLLGYDFQDFIETVFLAQRARERVGGLAELRTTLDRLTGVLACRRAAALAARQEAELNELRARMSAAVQREQAAATPERAEAALLSAIDDLVAEGAVLETEIGTGQLRLARARERLSQREQLAHDLEEIARLVEARDLGRELDNIERVAKNGLQTIPEAQSVAGMRLATARARLASAQELRLELERFAERVASRREEVERKLTRGRSGSLVDEREEAALEMERLSGRGRTWWRIGVALVAMAGAVAGVHHLPTEWRDFIALSWPVLGPFGPALQPANGIGLAILAAGSMLAIFGVAQHRRARRRGAVLRVAAEWLDHEIAERERERTFLGSRVSGSLLLSPELEHSPDPGLREHAEQIARQHGALLGAGELEQAIEQSEAEARSAEADLAALRQRESSLRVALAQVAARRSLAQGDELAGPVQQLGRHLSALHGLTELAAARCRALEELLAVDAIGTGLPAARILSALGAIKEALPQSTELAVDVERLAADHARRIQQLADLATRTKAARAELARREPEFSIKRAARAEADRLLARRDALDRELSRETLARQLLDETADRLRMGIARKLAAALEGALGELTGGRYSQVVVPAELTIQIHSEDKQALIAAEELSAGTRVQLDLALRLACMELFRELKVGGGEHFLFLDEPVEGLDPERARGFVQLLRQHAETCGQVFLAVTEHELAQAGERVIRLGEPGTAGTRPAAGPTEVHLTTLAS